MHPRALSLIAAIVCSALSSVAIAHTYERCDADGDHCVRITCDHDGDRCWRESEYGRSALYSRPGHWVCDADGDRCHFEYTGRRWDPHWDHRDRDDHEYEHEHDRP